MVRGKKRTGVAAIAISLIVTGSAGAAGQLNACTLSAIPIGGVGGNPCSPSGGAGPAERAPNCRSGL